MELVRSSTVLLDSVRHSSLSTVLEKTQRSRFMPLELYSSSRSSVPHPCRLKRGGSRLYKQSMRSLYRHTLDGFLPHPIPSPRQKSTSGKRFHLNACQKVLHVLVFLKSHHSKQQNHSNRHHSTRIQRYKQLTDLPDFLRRLQQRI